MENSLKGLISPKTKFGSPKKFQFESQNAKDYVETLEENVFHHGNLLLSVLKNQEKKDEDCILASETLEKLVKEIMELHKQIKTVKDERTLAVSRVLMSELMEHEIKHKLKETREDFDERLQEARFHIDRKDKLIYDLQVHNSELEQQIMCKQGNGAIVVPIKNEILQIYDVVERIRELISNFDEDIQFALTYKDFLIDFYKQSWTKAQVLQALLRNPVNVIEGQSRMVRLNMESEEPEVTIEFGGSDNEEPRHYRAFTLVNDSFQNIAHRRNTLSSGEDLISTVRNKLLSKIQSYERKIGLFAIDIQKCTEELNIFGLFILKLTQENNSLMKKLRKKPICKLISQYDH